MQISPVLHIPHVDWILLVWFSFPPPLINPATCWHKYGINIRSVSAFHSADGVGEGSRNVRQGKRIDKWPNLVMLTSPKLSFIMGWRWSERIWTSEKPYWKQVKIRSVLHYTCLTLVTESSWPVFHQGLWVSADAAASQTSKLEDKRNKISADQSQRAR